MFWDRAAGVYDLFADVWNKKTHGALCAYVEAQISPADEVLECACGTGLLTEGIAAKCKRLVATDFLKRCWKRRKEVREVWQCHIQARKHSANRRTRRAV
ncbi:MAG: hypothetical protein ACLR4A_18835 [Christensenellales bacterium]